MRLHGACSVQHPRLGALGHICPSGQVPIVMLAAILESGEANRLYTGLSLLLSTAVEGEPARGLVSFGALPVLAQRRYGGALAELVAALDEVDDLRLYACAAAVDQTATDAGLEIMSTPRFLKETAGARLIVV